LVGIDRRRRVGGHVADPHLPRIVAGAAPLTGRGVGEQRGDRRRQRRRRVLHRGRRSGAARARAHQHRHRCCHCHRPSPPWVRRLGAGRVTMVRMAAPTFRQRLLGNSLARTLLSIWAWLVLAVLLLIWLPVVAIVRLVTAPFDRGHYAAGYTLRKLAVVHQV